MNNYIADLIPSCKYIFTDTFIKDNTEIQPNVNDGYLLVLTFMTFIFTFFLFFFFNG